MAAGFLFVLRDRERQLAPQAEATKPVATAQKRRRASTGVTKEVADFSVGEQESLHAF